MIKRNFALMIKCVTSTYKQLLVEVYVYNVHIATSRPTYRSKINMCLTKQK